MFTDPAVLSALVIGALALIGTFVTSRQNKIGAKATTALTERAVDREEWEAYIDRQDKERERLEKRVSELESRLEAEVSAREDAELRAIRAERRAEALEHRVTQLEETLRAHNIPVPPHPDGSLPAGYP